MTRTCAPALDGGLGVVAYAFDMSDPARARAWDFTAVRARRALLAAAERTICEQPPGHAEAKYAPGVRVTSRRRVLGRRHRDRDDPLVRAQPGVADVLAFGVSDARLRGVAF